MRVRLPFTVLVLACVTGLAASVDAQTEIPIRSITLYRSGVAHFQRQGVVSGDASVALTFDAEQVNDILKSMLVLDLDGGRVESVGYGSKEPLARRLASFGVDISDNPDLAELLNRLRGAPVRVSTFEGTVEGTVLGVERRETPAGDQVTTVAHLNLVTEGGIRSAPIPSLRSIEALDAELQAELSKALAALAEQRAERVKSVDVRFSGRGERRVVVAYVHEMPVWKAAYRLVLPEETGKPTIQGWAIVENTTDEDWQDVRLSLVSGRPVSFVMDLYEPLFVTRPEVPVPAGAGVSPRVYGGGESYEEGKRLAETERSAGEALGRARRDAAPAAPEQPIVTFDANNQAFGEAAIGYAETLKATTLSLASGAEVGEVFQYQLDAPVTIERQRSAMLPILSASIEGRRVSIFNRNDGAEHPMRGVELTNSTGLQLMPGPISVFDGVAYAGDAQIGHVSDGDRRLLSYAVDLDVRGITTDDSTATIDRVTIAGGSLVYRSTNVNTVAYAFSNGDERRDRTVIVEHAKLGGWELVEPAKPYEETEWLYRFEVPIPAGKQAGLTVKQQQVQHTRYALVAADLRQLQVYVSQGKASEKVLEAVREAMRLQAAVNSIEGEIRSLDQERQRIEQDQQRIRQNMGAIDRQSDLYARYLSTLTTQEDRLEQIRSERQAREQALNEARRALETFLSGLNVD